MPKTLNEQLTNYPSLKKKAYNTHSGLYTTNLQVLQARNEKITSLFETGIIDIQACKIYFFYEPALII
jgi:hypothetical protein